LHEVYQEDDMGLKRVFPGIILAVIIFSTIFYSQALGQEQIPSPEFDAKVHDDVKEQVARSDAPIEVIIQLSGGDNQSNIEMLESIGNITHDYATIPYLSLEVRPEDIGEIAREGFVKSIEPNPVFRAQLQQSVTLVNASRTWLQMVSGMNLTGKGVGVCIIDTGVNYTHPDLGGCPNTSNINTAGCSRVVAGYDFVNDDTNPMDDVGHGTHVAGIAGANGGIMGVAPNISIIAIKSLAPGNPPSGTLDDIVAGIDWCVSNATLLNISVISMSLGDGGTYTSYCDGTYPSMTAAIDLAASKNITVVVASGNSGSTSGISNPACIRNATSIGSTNDGDAFSSFSNRNPILDLAAPGDGINSTSMQGGYVEFDGTSMATPHAAGMFAILYQKYRLLYNMSAPSSFFKDVAKSSGVNIYDSATGLNFSRIDVFNSSQQIQSAHSVSVSGNATIERGSAANLSALWSSNINLHTAILSTNETGDFANKSNVYGSPFLLTGTLAASYFSWSNSSLPNGTLVIWKVYGNDSAGNTNTTDTMNFTIVDTSVYITNLTQPYNVAYSATTLYTFNATVTDFTGIGSVIFEWNASENSTAYASQVLNSTSITYTANKTGLAFGNYTYRWIANDTLGNLNSVSATATDVVAKAPTSIKIFLNGTQSNFTYDRSSSANITAIMNVTSIGNISILLNVSGPSLEINSSLDSVSYLLQISTLAVGSYNVTALYNGSNSNYSQSRATLFFFVREGYKNSSVNIQPGMIEVVNASQTNVTLDFLTNDTIVNNETNVTVGTDNPVGTSPPGLHLGKFIRINVSQPIAGSLTYSVIRYRYVDSDLPSGIDESTLRIFRWNGSAWVKFDGHLVGGVDVEQNTVFANTTQFSDFTISGEPAQPPAPANPVSSGGSGGGGGSIVRKNVTSTKNTTVTNAPRTVANNSMDGKFNSTEPAPQDRVQPREESNERQVPRFDYLTAIILILVAAASGVLTFRKFGLANRHRRRHRMKGELEVTPFPY